MRNDTGRISTRIALITGAAAALLCGTAGIAVAAPASSNTGTVIGSGAVGAINDSYIVVTKPGAPTSADLTKKYGGQVVDNYTTAVKGFHVKMTATQAGHLAADPNVQFVEQDAVVARTSVQSDPTWGLDRIDQRSLPLSKSYTENTDASNVTAYVLDTGIRITNKDFGGRASYGWDFVDNDAVASDCNGHGTHVAGTIGGSQYGVAKNVNLVAVRVLDCDGSGSYSQIIAGVDWVTKNAVKPAVANMSIGGSVSKALDDAVNRSIASGVTYVVAAGNDGRKACNQSPADDPAAITVGATDSHDRRASYSNYGTCVDIFAPGSHITSDSNTTDNGTKTMSGTSMASPHVAGAAALVLAQHPDYTPAQVQATLVAYATAGKVGNPGAGSPNKLLYTGFLNTSDAATQRR